MMDPKRGKFTIKTFPKIRTLITDPLNASKSKNFVSGVFELNVSKIRQVSKANNVTFMSTIIYNISRAIEKHPKFNSYRKGKNLVHFDEVDISIMVERVVESERIPLPYVLRSANTKSLPAIDEELKLARTGELEELYLHRDMRIYLALPKLLRVIFWKILIRNPFMFKEKLGTVAVSALHSKGFSKFNFIPRTPYTTTIGLGGIFKDQDETVKMKLTICVDHDIIDGMDAIKFFRTLSDGSNQG